MTVSETAVTVREGAQNVDAFTVVLTAAPADTVTVSFTTSDADKVNAPQDITFTNSDWSMPKPVQLSVDQEPDTPVNTADTSARIDIETSVQNPETQDGDFHGLKASVAVTIEDDDKAGMQLSRTTQTVYEGTNNTDNTNNDPAQWTVRLNTDPGEEVTVTITSSDSSRATVDKTSIRFATNAGTNVFQWDQAQTVRVMGVADDDIVNDDVTFTHSITSGDYAAASAAVVVTVTDSSDAMIVTDLTALPVTGGTDEEVALREAGITHTITVPEGGTASYTMSLSARPSATTVVSFAEDSDLISVNRERITFRGGDWSKVRTNVITAGTDVNTVDETAIITHTASAGGGYDDEMIVLQVTIDDSNKAGLQLSRTGLTIGEGGDGTFTVRLNTEPTDDVTVTPSVEPATDEVTVLPETLTFTDETWEETQTVTVSTVEDEDAVNDTTGILLTVSGSATGYAAEQNRTVSITVDDNDSAGMVVSPTSVTVREGAQSVNAFTVVLTAAPADTVTVSFTSSDDEKVDAPQDITFTNSDWSMPKPVQLSVDQEPDTPVNTADTSARIDIETSVQNPETQDGDFHGLKASVAVTIEDDDKAGMQLSRTTQTVYEGTNNTDNTNNDPAQWTVRLNTDPGEEVTVTITSSDSSRATVDKTSIRFATNAGTNVFQWDQAQTVRVMGVADDDIVNDDVTFTHSITSGDYAAASAAVVVTVTDSSDAMILTDLTAVPETGGTQEEQDLRDAGVTHTITVPEGGTVSYTMNLSARPSATTVVSFAEDSDLISVNRERITFRGGDWSKARTNVITAGEDDDSMDTTAVITHTASAGGGYDGKMVVVQVTVDDNDKPGIVLSKSSLTIDEEGEGTFTVRLQTEPTGNVTLALTQPTDTNADVTTDPDMLTFTADNWDETQTVTVKAADDADVANDTATIQIAVSASEDTGYITSGQNRIIGNVSVTVTDNDSAGLVLSARSASVSEDASGSTEVVEVKLAGQPSEDVTIAIETDPDTLPTGVSVSPNQLTFTEQNWATGQDISVDPTTDADSDDYSFTIKLAASGGGYDELTDSVAVTITDVNKAGIKLSKSTSSIAEGATDTWTVQLNTNPGEGETVKVAVVSSDTGAATVNMTELTFTGEADGANDGTWGHGADGDGHG